MFSGSTHGINAGSKEDKPDEAKVKAREKEKAEVAEDFSNREDSKAEAREEEKAAPTWWEKKDMKMNGKKKMNGMSMKVFGQKIKTGMMPSGAQMNCTTRMSMVCSREKEKERKERKARKEKTMKEKANQVMAKASQTMYSRPLHRINPFRIKQQVHYTTSAASSSGHGFVSFSGTDPVRVDVLNANFAKQQDHRRTRRGGQHQRDAVAQRNRESLKRFPVLVGEVDALRQGLPRRPLQPGLQPDGEGTSFFTIGNSDQTETPSDMENGDSCQKERPSQHEGSDQTEESSEKDGVFSLQTNPVDACEKGLSFHTENSAPPTVCILDLGCTRAMGSRKAVDAFCRYVDSHPNSGLWYEIHPTSSRFFCKLSTVKVY